MAHDEQTRMTEPPCAGPSPDKEKKRPVQIITDDIFSRGATPEQMEALQKAVAAHKAAQVELMEAAGLLWNAKVDAAMTIGGSHGASVAMSQRLSFFDNCTCGPCPIVIHCW
ncbi:hypothetical protein [Bradyrhizobium lablabi]|uniref:hypothetical protein n=1 Tax=Bradyrhizobium lablabi TaxID=722472 RepID=UPI001BA8D587|nr:hypothetical protein [Bradyrhizobium lablabi]MBR0696587.1 hypothetical protein [Bradyrhizobium lablabi]